ncbi:hypothetical protein [Aquimarina sp. 2201CG5-10]|uniref:hypothetical protein n=1 Tax=Aquimarina callyspongiae TaxID=3098150 RepID=UPI002AB53160|nr:hypothetical protein [Aquimarina sp. 2201CG5-10]MDY8137512.1 hypothetical protein [Aquimarina sp. 2201CG5-10]
MEIKELEEIVYKYYPKKIDAYNQELYKETSEFKLLKETIDEKLTSELETHRIHKDLVSRISEKEKMRFIDMTYYTSLDRSHNLQLSKKFEDKYYQINLYTSVLIPCYLLIVRESEISQLEVNPFSSLKKTTNLDIDFLNETLQKIHETVEKNSFILLKDELHNHLIKDVSFEDVVFGKFTLFNAFFFNQYF